MSGRAIAILLATLLLTSCGGNGGNPAPPRVTTPATVEVAQSNVIVPVIVPLGDLVRLINAELPVELYRIDKPNATCVPAQRIGSLKITPKLGCKMVGSVRRGPVRIAANGATLRLMLPLQAEVSARNIGGIIKSETATAAADVRADVQLDLSSDWQPRAKVTIDYAWTKKPGIELLGTRITFADKADARLAEVVARLERDIPRHLIALRPRAKLESAWASGFTSVSLNRERPPVWLRITPQQLHYGGYFVENNVIMLRLAVDARTETFVGVRPPDPVATPLPRAQPLADSDGFHFRMPVVADYDQLEPVLAKALGKLAKKGLDLPDIGRVKLDFGKVTIYATENGRLAIGIAVDAALPNRLVSTRGTVWFTGIPYNMPGSQKVMVRNLDVSGTAENASGRLLLAIATAPAVKAEIATALSHDFAGDYAKLRVKIDKALTQKQVGDFILDAKISEIANGSIVPLGQGLYMPVDVTGTGEVRFSPRPAR